MSSKATAPASQDATLSRRHALLLETALVISWSAGFVGIRFASDHAPIFLILLWRSLVSGLLLLPFALLLAPKPQWRDVRDQLAMGGIAMAGYLGCFALAIGRGVPTGLVALITDMLPLLVALMSWPVLGQTLAGRQWAGTLIGFLGVVVAADLGAVRADVPLWAYGLPVLGTAALGLATLLQRDSHSRHMPVHQRLCIQCLGAAAAFAPFAWFEGGVAPAWNAGFAGGVLWLVLVATYGAWGLYYLALRHTSAARVTSTLYLSPPVTMLWAWLVFAEPLSWVMAAGLLVSLAGIVIFASGERQGRPGA